MEVCLHCNQVAVEHSKDEWIQCDGCLAWDHRFCAARNNTQLPTDIEPSGPWFCSVCIRTRTRKRLQGDNSNEEYRPMKRRKLQETRAKGNVIRASKWRISIRKLSPESEENSAGDEEWPKQSIESNSKSRRSRALANEPQPRPSSLPAPPVGIPNMGNNCFMVAVFRGWATIPAMRKAWASLLLSARTGEVVTILSGRNELSRSVSERKPPSISTNVAKLRASISTLVFSLDGQETALQFHLQIVTQLRRSHNPFQTWSQIIRLNDSAIPP